MNKPSARRPSSARRRSKPAVQRNSSAQPRTPEQTATSGQRFVDERFGEGRSVKASPQVSATSKQPSTVQRLWRTWKPHVRTYGPPLLLNHAVTVGIILAISVIVGVGAGFARVPATIGSLWMVVNMAPLNMTGAQLGFLPLLPAMILVWAYARRARTILGRRMSVRGLRAFIALSLVIPLVLTLIAWFMLWDASGVFNIAAPNIFVALISTLLVNGAAVVIGMGPPVWRALLIRRDFPTWPVEAFRLAARFLVWMFGAGVLAAVIYIATNATAFMATYDITSDLMGATGLSLLALMYVPNIAIGAMAILLGGEFHIGHGAISLFTSTNVNLPPLPVLAAVPNQPLPGGPFYLLLPAAVAVVVVYRYLKTRDFIEAPVATSVGAGAAVAFLGFCLAWLGGGELGVYGTAGALEWLFAAECAAWLMAPALVLMLWAARAGSTVVEDVAPAAESAMPPSSQPTPVGDEEDKGAAEAEAEEEDREEDREENREDKKEEKEGEDEDSDSGLGDGNASPKRD